MRFFEIYEQLQEGIPMGQKALSTPTKKNYTFGAELEMYVDPSHIENKVSRETAYEELDKTKKIDYLALSIEQEIISKYGYETSILKNLIKNEPEKIFDIIKDVTNMELNSDVSYYNPKEYFDKQGYGETIQKIENYSLQQEMNKQEKREFLLDIAEFKHVFIEKRGQRDNISSAISGLSDEKLDDTISLYVTKVKDIVENLDLKDETDYNTLVKDDKIHRISDIISYVVEDYNLFSVIKVLTYINNTYDLVSFSISEDEMGEYSEYIEDQIDEYLEKNKTDAFDYVKDYFEPHVKVENVVPDSSLQDYDLEGVELIIGVYQDQNSFLSDLKKSFNMMKSNEAITTSSDTGLHINIGTFSEEEIKNIDLLKFLLILEGDRILQEFGREFNEYSQSMGDTIGKSLQYALEGGDIRQYDQVKDEISKMIRRKAKKYDMVNLQKLYHGGIIEVRAFGNEDYEYHFDLVEKNIKRVLRALEIAQDGNAYRKEYLKKLSKHIKSDDRIPPKVHEALTKFGNAVGAASPEYQTYSYQSPYILHLLYVFQKSRDNGDWEKLEENWNPIIGAYYVKLLTIDTRKNLSTIKNANDRLRQYIDEFEVERFAPKLVAEMKKYKMI